MTKNYALYLIFVVSIVATIVGCGSGDENAEEDSASEAHSDIEQYTIGEIFQAYEDDALDATNMYRGEIVSVKARLVSLGRELADGSPRWELFSANSQEGQVLGQVRFLEDSVPSDDLAGKIVWIDGEVSGMKIDRSSGKYILIKDGRVIEVVDE